MQTQKTIISAAFVIASFYGLSAILGLVRSRLLATYFGASEVLGVFYTADKIPSFIYTILVVGTLSTIFIPVFTNLRKNNEDSAWHTASLMITVSVLSFIFLGVLVFAFAPLIIRLLSVGRFTEEQVRLGAGLMRIMIGAQLLLVVSSFVTSVLQSFRYFIIPALAPVLYNLGMILGIVFLTSRLGIYGPAVGVVIGALLHLFVQIPLLRKVGFSYSFFFDTADAGLKEILTLIPPRIFGVTLAQIFSIVNNSLAILISTSSVVILKFADQLQSFPINLFGASIALAALPTLSLEADETNRQGFKKTFLTSFHQMLFFVVPASVLLLILKLPAVRLVYGAAKFPWEATLETSYALAFFSLSIFAQSANYLLTRAFYAMKDTLTPVKINFFTVLLSILTSLFFIKNLGLGVWSIAMSCSIWTIVDATILIVLLSKKVGGFDFNSVFNPFMKIGASAVFMGLALYFPLRLLDQWVFDTTRTLPLIALTLVVSLIGALVYLIFTWLFKVEEIQLLYKLLRRLNLVKTVPTPVSEISRD